MNTLGTDHSRRRVKPPWAAFVTLATFWVTACQERQADPGTFQATDSAGVTVVESTGPVWVDGEGWTLAPEPEVIIGAVEGDERYLLDGAAGARRLSDGRIAVLDVGSRRVRLYDRTGEHLMDLGGDGDGPSEFRTPQFLGLVSDTLVVYEYFPGSLTWFSPDGGFLRTSTVFAQSDGEIPRAMMLGIVEGIFGIALRIVGDRDRPHVEGLNRHPNPVWRFHLTNPAADSVFSVPGSEDMVNFPNPGAIQHRPVVFGNTTYLTAAGAHIYLAPTDEFSIQVRDIDGNLRRIVRRIDAPREVTSDDVNEYVESRIEALDLPPDRRTEFEQTVRQFRVAETMPAFRWVVADSEGNLWVEEWEGVGFEQGRFSVFRSDGAWLGRIDLPTGLPESRGGLFQPWIDIGPDYLLGVWTDDYGVEQVRLYRIEKG